MGIITIINITNMKKLFIVLLLICIPFPNVFSQSKEDLEAAEELNKGFRYLTGTGVTQDYEYAYSVFNRVYLRSLSNKKLENSGLLSQYGLGLCFYNGWGIPKDYQKAYTYFHILCMHSVDNDIPDVGFYLGECLYYGYGTTINKKEAATAYIHSALCGSSSSRIKLGYCMLNREFDIVDKSDYEDVFSWLNEESDKNISDAMYILAHLYKNGIGCEKDEEKSKAYLKKSALLGNEQAKSELGL